MQGTYSVLANIHAIAAALYASCIHRDPDRDTHPDSPPVRGPLLTTPLNPIRYTLPDFYFRSSYSHSPSCQLARFVRAPDFDESIAAMRGARIFAIRRTSLCDSSNLSLLFVEPLFAIRRT